MKEKTLKARAGMPVLFLSILLYIAAVLLVIWGAVLLEAAAVDRDAGENGRVRYRLLPRTGHPFVVDEDTGRVSRERE